MKLSRNILAVSSIFTCASAEPTRLAHGFKGGKSGKSSKASSAVVGKSSKASSYVISGYGGKSGKNSTASSDAVSYEADLGTYGSFHISIHPDGTTSYDVNLQNLDWVTTSELTWHLHSGKIGSGPSNASNGPATACGPSFTAGHYDPMLKCGSATTAPSCDDVATGVPCCFVKPANDYCANQNIGTCEIGDLSGLYGKLKVENEEAELKTMGGLCPDCVEHYMPKATATDGSATYRTWASVVFHGSKDDPGERVLCADIKMV